MTIWQNGCLGQFYRSRIEVLQNAQVFGSSYFFVIRENLRGLIENLKQKIRPSVPAMTTLLMKIFKKMNPYDTQKLRKMVAKRRKYSKKLTTEKIRTQRKLFPKEVEIG